MAFKVPFAELGTGELVDPQSYRRPAVIRCPGCHWRLVYRSGRRIRSHFAHRPGAEAIASAACGETALHRAAKAILLEITKLPLPKAEYQYNRFPFTQATVYPGGRFHVDSARDEVAIHEGQRIADTVLTGTATGAAGFKGELVVEVAVTNPLGDDRRHDYRRKDTPCIEINLGDLPSMPDMADIRTAVLDSKRQRWIHHPNFQETRTQVLKAARKKQQELRNTARTELAREEARRRRETEAARAKSADKARALEELHIWLDEILIESFVDGGAERLERHWQAYSARLNENEIGEAIQAGLLATGIALGLRGNQYRTRPADLTKQIGDALPGKEGFQKFLKYMVQYAPEIMADTETIAGVAAAIRREPGEVLWILERHLDAGVVVPKVIEEGHAYLKRVAENHERYRRELAKIHSSESNTDAADLAVNDGLRKQEQAFLENPEQFGQRTAKRYGRCPICGRKQFIKYLPGHPPKHSPCKTPTCVGKVTVPE